MWSLFPLKIRYGVPAVVAIAVFLAFNELLDKPLLNSISYTVTAITFLAWLFGKHLWRYVYIDYLKNRFCPDFNGKWVGKVESNFGGGKRIEFPVEIEADFFSIKMKGKTTVGRTYANYCKVVRAEDGCFELEYMFKGFNDTPSETDDSYYEGAARLRVMDISTMHMTGVFWTNRCWQNGRNTAGVIELFKEV
ncbi:hypothetical protein KUW18_09095 [Halomonas sp. DP5Y7-2]|uniref:hypothetical protein n=1 Tax=Halomonas sp. DP5Y7-2 TaxID=2859076 RepID=UPI001C9963C5|nr:hypothetical protein [Halomonas sp. DP5Y7-2]MBY5984246.1 hypothetical protein [Halomonas sp. DP5Y7-2]